jgi:hypothetical protein
MSLWTVLYIWLGLLFVGGSVAHIMGRRTQNLAGARRYCGSVASAAATPQART